MNCRIGIVKNAAASHAPNSNNRTVTIALGLLITLQLEFSAIGYSIEALQKRGKRGRINEKAQMNAGIEPWRSSENMATPQQIDEISTRLSDWLLADRPVTYVVKPPATHAIAFTVVPPGFTLEKDTIPENPAELFRMVITEQPDVLSPVANRREFSLELESRSDDPQLRLRIARYDITRLRERQREFSGKQALYAALPDGAEKVQARRAVAVAAMTVKRLGHELRRRTPRPPATASEADHLLEIFRLVDRNAS